MPLETEDITWVQALSIKQIQIYILIACCILILGSCTENPIFKEKINTSARQTITGNVKLESQIDHSNIIVYFEGLNITTVTDSDGNFQITLSDNVVQSNRNVSGGFEIYYYVANYKLESSQIIISKGIFVYGESDLDTDGNIKNQYVLKKILDIQTEVTLDSIDTGFGGEFFVLMNLSPLIDSVSVRANMVKDKQFASVILKAENSNILINDEDSTPQTVIIRNDESWFMLIDWDQYGNEGLQGSFEVIPYLQIIQENMPEELLKTIAKNANIFSADFLKIPFRRTSPTLTITAATQQNR